jgi:hypothetical protein
MKRLTACVIALGCGLLGSATGFWFGIGEGINLGVMLASSPRASISLVHLRALDTGKTQNMRVALEGDIDNALLWSKALEDSPLYPVLQPLWGFDLAYLPKYLTRLADYRKEHRSPLGPEVLTTPEPRSEEERAVRNEMMEQARQNERIIAEVVSRYATKPAGSSPR